MHGLMNDMSFSGLCSTAIQQGVRDLITICYRIPGLPPLAVLTPEPYQHMPSLTTNCAVISQPIVHPH